MDNLKGKNKVNNLITSFKELKWYEIIMIAIMVIIAGMAVYDAIIKPGETPLWLTIINFISAICGIICIFFCAKANISNFIFGLINTIVYAIFLFYFKIYGTFCLEIFFYLPMNILAWIRWAKHRDEIEKQKTKAKRLTIKENIFTIILVGIVTTITYFVLRQIEGTVAFLDALTVAIGLVATTLELFRYAEQYVWWLVTDVVAVAMYIIKFDPVYLTKKSIYLIMAIIGLINWLKLNKKRNQINE